LREGELDEIKDKGIEEREEPRMALSFSNSVTHRVVGPLAKTGNCVFLESKM
jgi:hypothetical protein